jgi:uncharacterized phage protein gp47/JayE
MKVFERSLKDSGLPVTETALTEAFNKLATEQGLPFNNPSPYSPWRRLLQALAIKPTQWLMQFMVRELMPNLFVKTASGEFLTLLGWGYGVERKAAKKLQGLIEFTRESLDQQPNIPTGTWIQTAPINGAVYRVQTLHPADFQPNQFVAQVTVEAETEGAQYNLGAGYFVILPKPLPGISSVLNPDDWILSPGDDEEPDDNYRLRVRNQFQAASDYHTNAVYARIIAEQTGFNTNRIYFEYATETRGPGAVDALVLFDAQAPSEAYLKKVNAYIRDGGHHGHGDDLVVKPLPETQHDISAELYLPNNLSDQQQQQIKARVQHIIEAAFRKNTDYPVTLTWPYDRFSFARLGAEILRLEPLIDSIEWGQGDIVSQLTVPRLQSLQLEVKS